MDFFIKGQFCLLRTVIQFKALRLKLHDKPTISFTDLTSMVVMEELGINQVMTGDAHFSQVGLGFQLVP